MPPLKKQRKKQARGDSRPSPFSAPPGRPDDVAGPSCRVKADETGIIVAAEHDRQQSHSSRQEISDDLPSLTLGPLINRRGHDFRNISNADHSRSHFGDVYNIQQASPPPTDTARKDMMEALSFEGMSSRLATVSPALRETCSWISSISEYTRWRCSNSRNLHNGILWVKGKAGVGKSTIMRCVYDRAETHHGDEVAIAFFFNARSTKFLAKSAEGMYRSLLHQILDHVPRLQHEMKKSTHIVKQQIWSVDLLESLFRVAVLGLTSKEKITCYIDALDECETADVHRAVEFLGDLLETVTQQKNKFLLCLSSRHYPHITIAHHEEINLDVRPEHMHDISRYLTRKLAFAAENQAGLHEEISRRCSGIFLWVVLVVEMLKRKNDIGGSRSDLYATLTKIPDGLQDLFLSISDAADASFLVAMRWMLFAKETLRLKELYFAIQTGTGKLTTGYWDRDEIDTEGMKRFVLHVSRGLIELISDSPWSGRRAQFIHEAVREHLLSGPLAAVHELTSMQHDTQTTNEALMAKDCCTYLQSSLPGSSSAIVRARNDKREYGLTELSWEYPLIQYASSYVLRHSASAIGVELALLAALPIRHITVLRNLDRHPRNELITEHSASFLYYLLEENCLRLAEAWSKIYSPDLTTLCGGFYGSPLHLAVHLSDHRLFELFIDQGADINLRGTMLSRFGYLSPLEQAVDGRSESMAKIILDRGAGADNREMSNALQMASRGRDVGMVRLLLDYGAEASAKDEHSLSPLCLAVQGFSGTEREKEGLISTVCALLDAGADVDATDEDGNTALIVACSRGRSQLFDILLQYGANIDHRSHTMGTATEVATRRGHARFAALLSKEVERRSGASAQATAYF